MSETITAYPLTWPNGWPREKYPEQSRFKSSFLTTRIQLFKELEMLGASEIVLSTNIELKLDGFPYANRRQPDDKGVAVYFKYKNKPMTFACDRWDKVGDNMRAIKKTIEAIRGIARWGASDMIEKAFTGFVSITDESSDSWWIVLGVSENSTYDEVFSAYKQKRIKHHPDKSGGNKENFIKIQEAFKHYCESFKEH